MRISIRVETHGDTFEVDMHFMDTMTGAYRGDQIDEAVLRIKAALGIKNDPHAAGALPHAD